MSVTGPAQSAAPSFVHGVIPGVEGLRNRALSILIVTALAGVLITFVNSGVSLGTFIAAVGAAAIVIVRWQTQRGKVRQAPVYVFSLINVIAVVVALTSPALVTILLAAPLAGLAVAMLWLPRHLATVLALLTPALMSIIHLVGHRDEVARGEYRDALLLTACVFILGSVAAHFIRKSAAWRIELNDRALEARAYLASFRAALEDQVAERTRKLEAQNATLDADRLEALRLSRIKTDHPATLSHEIRTPMNGILGMSELLLSMSLPARQREYAGIIHESGKALMTIINDILDYARLEKGSLSVIPGPCDPIPICRDAMRLLSGRAKEKCLLLDLVNDTPKGSSCLADPGRLREVLLNLLGNAVKYTDSGAVILRVADNNGRLRFEVQDTGMGIPSEFQQMLFQPFSRADGTDTRAGSGSGLGLAICKQLVEQMNGEIGVYSVAGDGSTFWFNLPVSPTPEAPSPDGLATSA